MKAVIFGAGGQDGFYLAKILHREKIEVHAFNRMGCDVSRASRVHEIIQQVRPDYVFNFAGVSSVKHTALGMNQDAIVNGTLYILQACHEHAPDARVFLTGSILQFRRDKLVSLDSPLAFDSAYSAQRHAAVAMGRYYRALGLKVHVGFFGHHDSPLRPPYHLAQRIAQEAKKAAHGGKVYLSDPDDQKEWNFAGDFMEAVWLLVNSTTHEAVIGSGVTHSVRDYAVDCLRAAGEMEPWQHLQCHTTRPYSIVTSTAPQTVKALGWEPRVSMEQLAKMMVAGVP